MPATVMERDLPKTIAQYCLLKITAGLWISFNNCILLQTGLFIHTPYWYEHVHHSEQVRTSTSKTIVMKPETILQSDLLDIVFEGRNKEYGAYALRKHYNHRLVHAMGATMLLVGSFILLQRILPG